MRVTKVKRVRVARTNVVHHHHYKGLPRRGSMVKSLNASAGTINFSGAAFRYDLGIWYKPIRNELRVIRLVRCLRINTLPVGYRKVMVNPRKYYYYYGTYYFQVDEEFEVIDSIIGAEVDSLPECYDLVSINGDNFYELDVTYYMPGVNESGE